MIESGQITVSLFAGIAFFLIANQWNYDAHHNPHIDSKEHSRHLVVSELLLAALVWVITYKMVDLALVYFSQLK